MTPARRRTVLYKAAPGAGFNDKQAQKYGAYLAEIGLDREPGRAPQQIVDASKPVSAPTHEVFDWDNEEAGNNWRLHQARQLVNHLLVVDRTPEGMPVERRAFQSVVMKSEDTGERPTRGYVARDVVWQRPDLEEQVHAAAVRVIEGWLDRWGDDDVAFAEADRIWQAYRAQRARRRRRAA